MGLSMCPGVWLAEFPAEQQEELLGTPPSPTAVAGTMLSSAPTEPCGEGLCPGELQHGELLHRCLTVEGLLVSGAALPPAPEGLWIPWTT